METRVYLTGTVHISKESEKKVKDAITTYMPDAVCLELDLNRFMRVRELIMEKSRGTDKEGARLSTDQKSIRISSDPRHFRYSGGRSGGIDKQKRVVMKAPIVYRALHWLQQRMGEEFGVFPGSEMIGAVEASFSYKLPVVLIDRPVEQTFSRLFKKMLFKEKMRLFLYTGLSVGFFTLKPVIGDRFMSVLPGARRIDIEGLEKGEGIEDLLEEFKEKFPTVYSVLVEERNKYMVTNIKDILTRKDKVLVVVGMGHVSGMEELFKESGVPYEVL